MEVSVAVLKGYQIHKDVKVDSIPYVIGRCRTANFIIAHVNVSRNHCHIVRENYLWKVNDYSSSGTYVNDELVGKGQSRILNTGDVIRFGPVESNLCWAFYPLNECINGSEQCEELLEKNTIKDHMKDRESNNEIFHEDDKTNKLDQELLKRTELNMSIIRNGFSPSVEHNGKGCEKIIVQSKKCENEVIDFTLHERKHIGQTEKLQNKCVDIQFQLNSDMTEEKVKLETESCKNQAIVTEKKSSLYKRELQNNSFVPEENENNETETFLKKQNAIEKSTETYVIKEPCFSENILGMDQQENIHNQKYLSLTKKAKIETETNINHDDIGQSTPNKTEELMKELEQLKSALNDLEYKNSTLEGELAAASSSKNEALQLKSNLLENLADLMEDELQCTICSELFVQAITLGCTHTFCKFCISQWRKKQKTCPICRKKITNETRSLVVDNYIDKMVGNLSLELKERREIIIAERNESQHQRKVKVQKARVSIFR